MAFCDICGTTLDEDEAEREIKGKQVCHDCMFDGLELLQETVSNLKRAGRDSLESKQAIEEEKEAAQAETEGQKQDATEENAGAESRDDTPTDE